MKNEKELEKELFYELFYQKDNHEEQGGTIQNLQKQINDLRIKLDKEHHDRDIQNRKTIRIMDTYKYRLTQRTPWGNINHFFHEDREEQLIKLIGYCNKNNIEYELNEKAKEFHNKLYNMILKGE